MDRNYIKLIWRWSGYAFVKLEQCVCINRWIFLIETKQLTNWFSYFFVNKPFTVIMNTNADGFYIGRNITKKIKKNPMLHYKWKVHWLHVHVQFIQSYRFYIISSLIGRYTVHAQFLYITSKLSKPKLKAPDVMLQSTPPPPSSSFLV